MTLRTRMAILVGTITALAMLAGGVLSYAAVSDEQYHTVDRFLQRRGFGPDRIDGGREFPFGSNPFEGELPPLDDGVAFQVTAPDGSVLITSDPDREFDVPGPDQLGELRTVELDGERFRVTAEAGPDGTVVQIARSLTEADDTVAAIRNRLWILGVVVSLLAAALGWLAAAKISRPLERLTSSADHIARTTELEMVETPAHDADTRFEVTRLSASFSAMVDALRNSRDLQQQFVADAGHEMRTPLTTLRTNVELLQSDRMSPDDQRRSLDVIATEVDELTNLTNELVELSTEVDAGEAATEIDLYEITASATERARARHGREIVLTGAVDNVVGGQPAGLDRAISNLIDNAAKFSSEPTAIDVRVDAGRVSVRDRGPGIAATDRDRVFERFYRAQNARTLPGSGLGLAIVAKIARDHGGEAFVADPPEGDGVVVGFTIGDS